MKQLRHKADARFGVCRKEHSPFFFYLQQTGFRLDVRPNVNGFYVMIDGVWEFIPEAGRLPRVVVNLFTSFIRKGKYV